MSDVYELTQGLGWVQDVLGYKGVDLTVELVWVFDDFYVNVWDNFAKKYLVEHLSSRGDFEDVWKWLATHYPEVDWDEQEF